MAPVRDRRCMQIRAVALALLATLPLVLLAMPAAADHPYCIQNTHFFTAGSRSAYLPAAQHDVWGVVPLVVGDLPLIEVSVNTGSAAITITEPQTCRVFICASVATATHVVSCIVPPGYWDVIIDNIGGIGLTYTLRIA